MEILVFPACECLARAGLQRSTRWTGSVRDQDEEPCAAAKPTTLHLRMSTAPVSPPAVYTPLANSYGMLLQARSSLLPASTLPRYLIAAIVRWLCKVSPASSAAARLC